MQRPQARSYSGTTAGKAKPNFFIVGAPKCGTTSLHEYLQRHPDVFMPFYKEPHYFGSDLEGSRFRQFRGQPERYLKLFRDARGEQRIGESSPWYLSSRRAAEEIHAYEPQAKIIIMLRNPVDMMYSMWSQFRYSGNEQIETFEAALEAEPERRRGERIRRAAHCISGLYYRDMARFSEQVGRYFELFGRERRQGCHIRRFQVRHGVGLSRGAGVPGDRQRLRDEFRYCQSQQRGAVGVAAKADRQQRILVDAVKGPPDIPGDYARAGAVFLSNAGGERRDRGLHQI